VPCPTDRPTVLFLGRHEPRKGLGVLLEAFAALDGGARLWVAGWGPETRALQRKYPPSEQLEWLGMLEEHEVAERLAGAHVLAAPSLGGESFGMVLAEALAARTVVVASDLEGYREVVGDCGELVAPGDVGGLTKALAVTLDDAAMPRAAVHLPHSTRPSGVPTDGRWTRSPSSISSATGAPSQRSPPPRPSSLAAMATSPNPRPQGRHALGRAGRAEAGRPEPVAQSPEGLGRGLGGSRQQGGRSQSNRGGRPPERSQRPAERPCRCRSAPPR